MPNYNLSDSIKAHVQVQAAHQAARRYAHMTGVFPLTTVEVQDALMDADTLRAFRDLDARSQFVIQKQNTMGVRLDRDAFPGLQRTCSFMVALPESVFVTHPYTKWGPRGVPKRGDRERATLEEGTLSDDARERLVKWANNAVRESRLRDMTNYTVQEVLRDCKTAADLLSRWPLLATLVDETDAYHARWRSRFRNPITRRFLEKYKPGQAWVDQYKTRMAAAELVINTGLLMGDYSHDSAHSKGDMTAWERLPNDPPNT